MYKKNNTKRIAIISVILLSGLNVDFQNLFGRILYSEIWCPFFIYIIRLCIVVYGVYSLVIRKMPIKPILVISIYFLGVQIINFVNFAKGSMDSDIEYVHRIFSMTYLFLYYIVIISILKKNRNDFFQAMFITGSSLMYVSLLLFFLKPELGQFCIRSGEYVLRGVSTNRNVVIEFWILGTIGLIGCGQTINYKKVIWWMGTIPIQGMTKSGTGYIVMFIVLISLLVYKKGNCIFKIYINIAQLLIFLVYIVMGIFQIQLFQYVIVHILHKSPTMTGRLDIWAKDMKAIMDSILLGYGYDAWNNLKINYGILAHDNSLIYFLIVSGILGGILWIFVFSCSHINFWNASRINIECASCVIGVLAYLVRGISESVLSYPHIVPWIIFILLLTENEKQRRKVSL